MRHDEVLIVAAVFAVGHLVSPWLFRLQQPFRESVSSFSGGLASAYVFLHLLPEISTGGELLGPRIYVVVLVGLAGYYGVEIVIHRSRGDRGKRINARLHFLASAVYTCLLLFTLCQQLPDSAALTLATAVTIGLHLVSNDFGLQEEYGERFVRRGRYLLVAATIAGYGLTFVREPHEEVLDLLTALLAGFIMFNAFRKELPEIREARFGAFLSGMGLFLVGHVVLRGIAS